MKQITTWEQRITELLDDLSQVDSGDLSAYTAKRLKIKFIKKFIKKAILEEV